MHCNVTSLTSLQLDQPHVLFMEAEYENRTRTCGTSVTSADAGFDRCYGVYVYACRNFTRPQCKARGNKKGITSFGGKGTLTTIGASYVQERRLFY